MLRVTVLVLVCIAACQERSQALVFDCFPNATYRVENPGSYQTVVSNNNIGICNASWLEGYSHVLITGCDLGDEILIFFSNLDPVIEGGSGSHQPENATFSINCVQLPGGGMQKTVNNLLETSIQDTVSRYYHVPVSSNMYKNLGNKKHPGDIAVGTPLFWVIETELADYDLKPEECWAYAGRTITPTALRKHVITDGCSRDGLLMKNFKRRGSKRGHIVRTIVYAFRFYTSEYITMQCQVRVCPKSSDACEISCAKDLRRRRMADSIYDPVDSNSNNITHLRKQARAVKVVTNSVRVVDRVESEFTLASESTGIESKCILLVLMWSVLKLF